MNRHLTPALAAFAIGEPVLPVGFLPNGRPVFPIAGGADDGDGADDSDGGDQSDSDKGKPPAYRPPATQSDLDRIVGDRLAREREAARTRYADYDDLKKKAAQHDKAIEAARTDQEKAVEAAKAEGRTEVRSATNTRLVSAEARALAAEARFRNPSLAVKALDLKGVAVNDDGEPDKAAIAGKLKELSDADPYLVDDGKPAKPKPDRAQGGSTGDKGDASVSRGRDMFENRRGAKKTTVSQ